MMIRQIFITSSLAFVLFSAHPVVAGTDNKAPVVVTESFTVTGNVSIEPASGAMTGEGVIRWTNGEIYEGTLLDGNKQGRGIFVWRDGQRYEGEWAEDRITGQGRLVYANGDRYEGEFLNGEPHGSGTYTSAGGDVYRGAWVNGNKQGKGRLTWEDGDYWEGEFSQGQPTENGKLVLGNAPDEPEQPVRIATAKTGKRPLPKNAK